MPCPGRRLVLAAVATFAPAMGGCTLVKPVVGAVTGPVIMMGHSNGDFGGCGCDGRAFLCVFAVMAAVGATGGLVTGIVSDVQVVFGEVENPTNNWWDPFAFNTSACR